MDKKTLYVCIEGIDGVGKTTLIQHLSEKLLECGYSVLCTKEPGSSHIPLTQDLRKFVLDNQFENEMTPLGREYIIQAIRSIHLEKLIYPSIKGKKYDVILQDRGIVSGVAYGLENGLPLDVLMDFAERTLETNARKDIFSQNRPKTCLYDLVILLSGDLSICLERTLARKQEFHSGDVMENKGVTFMRKVFSNMKDHARCFTEEVIEVETNGKSELDIADICYRILDASKISQIRKMLSDNKVRSIIINNALPQFSAEVEDGLGNGIEEIREEQDALISKLVECAGNGIPYFIHSGRRSGKTWTLLRFIHKSLHGNQSKDMVLFVNSSRDIANRTRILNMFSENKLDASEDRMTIRISNRVILSDDELNDYYYTLRDYRGDLVIYGTRVVNPVSKRSVFITLSTPIKKNYELRSLIFDNPQLVFLFDEYCFSSFYQELNSIRDIGYGFKSNIIAISTLPKVRTEVNTINENTTKIVNVLSTINSKTSEI